MDSFLSLSFPLAPNDHILFGNRANVYLKLKQFREAEIDADNAIRLRPDWSKGKKKLNDGFHRIAWGFSIRHVRSDDCRSSQNLFSLKGFFRKAQALAAQQKLVEACGSYLQCLLLDESREVKTHLGQVCPCFAVALPKTLFRHQLENGALFILIDTVETCNITDARKTEIRLSMSSFSDPCNSNIGDSRKKLLTATIYWSLVMRYCGI